MRLRYSRQSVFLRAIIATVPIVAVVAAGIFTASFGGKEKLANATAGKPEEHVIAVEENPLVAVVGTDSSVATASAITNNSWPGEVLSYGNVLIQPEREGTIVEWRVKIGERVRYGQTLALLSSPPSTPELVKMLAEQSEGLARARAQSAATERFTEKNNEQMRALLAVAATTTNEAQDVLTSTSGRAGTAKAAVDKVRSEAVTMKQNLHTMLERMLTKHIGMVGASGRPTLALGNLNPSYGATDVQNRNTYEARLSELIQALKDPDALPVDLTTKYFISFTQLANTTGADVPDIRDMAQDDQEKFLDMLAKYRSSEAEAAMKETEYSLMSADKTQGYAESKRMVEEKISENDKMLSMARAEIAAAEAAYATVSKSITGGLAIVASHSGTVSTISKNIGDFVGPGMPVASITTNGNLQRFVRLHIPNNIQLPRAGEVLSVVRPGFTQNVQKVTITGIGASLDSTGSYSADATLDGVVDWPVGASVRVVASDISSAPVIRLSSVWWDEEGVPQVWGVSNAGRIFAKKITIGRTLGTLIEVYEGLKNGDRYIISPTKEIHENALLEDITPKDTGSNSQGESDGKNSMGEMEM